MSLTTQLIRHQFQQARRSPAFGQNLAINIFLGLLGLYFFVIFAIFGIFFDKIIEETVSFASPLVVMQSYVLPYLLFDFAFRLVFQSLPTVQIIPYLAQPISRSAIAQRLQVSSWLSILNFWQLLFIIPQGIKLAIPAYGIAGGLAWMLGLWLLVLTLSNIAVVVAQWLSKDIKLFFAVLGIVAIALAAGLAGFYPLLSWSAAMVAAIGSMPFLVLLPAAAFAATAYVLQKQLEKRLYIDWATPGKTSTLRESGWLSRLIGDNTFLQMQYRLLARNKRTKVQLRFMVIFIFYGFLFYRDDGFYEMYGFLIFVGILLSGSFVMNMGKLNFAWESSFFDGLLVQPIPMREYLEKKYKMLAGSVILLYVLTLFYPFIFGMELLAINTCTAIFNIGISVPLVLYGSVFNKKRVDITQKGAFNMQGMSATDMLFGFVIAALPIALFYVFSALGLGENAIYLLALVGLIGIVLHKQLLDQIYLKFRERRYEMSAGFRKID